MSTGPQDSSMEQLCLQRGEHTSYQIFPEPSEQTKGTAARLKERLPSIVVEPTEESGEHIHEEDDPCDPCDPCDPVGSTQPQAHVDGVPSFKRSCIPSIQIDYSKLTPPPSPTSSRVAPPCFPPERRTADERNISTDHNTTDTQSELTNMGFKPSYKPKCKGLGF
ncbi:uncharacterized protein LOC143750649 isoform X2 [Siphateles boraxobius]|uniref:uncharacterized protein LOC143750649 isoform X2 n=1 Tax=Siphateles boraxobius TaxID=180520 RepID=UPI0040649D83